MENEGIALDAVIEALSERGRLEWELAVLRAQNAVLAAQLADVAADAATPDVQEG